ncbi:MAG: ATP-binding cassette domain-containing protein, partial [Parabacteroides sp.]|nr:ATP-binding cassette domain-containing protein [Parabacteroides sp.]
MINISHIKKYFNDKLILDDVSLSIEERGAVCIIGQMGCGKSTLLRCIAGLEFPEEGEVCVFG